MPIRRGVNGGEKLQLVVMMLVILAFFDTGFAALPGARIAIVQLKGIKPYESLGKVISDNLQANSKVSIFSLEGSSDPDEAVKQKLTDFKPDVIVCIGNMACQFCNSLDIAPVVLAYDTDFFDDLNPFDILQCLRPQAKKVAAIVSQGLTAEKAKSIEMMAENFGLNLTIAKEKPDSWKELLSGSDAIIVNEVLIIKVRSAERISDSPRAVAIVNSQIEMYKQLQKDCLDQLPQVDQIIDSSNSSSVAQKLANDKPEIIICIGIDSYQYCKSITGDAEILIVLKGESLTGDIHRWDDVGGVPMLADPKEQLQSLSELVQKPVKIAMPYNPANTDMLIARAMLAEQEDITLVPLAVENSNKASKWIGKAFDDCDGILVIPNKMISVEAIQELLLAESLQREKVLVTMMHPYTKRGAAMGVCGVGKNTDLLCQKVIELADDRFAKKSKVGKLIWPEASISLNLRTIKKLNYDVPKSLLDKAEDVFGKID